MKLFAKIFKTKSTGNKLPEGWTETKVTENTFVTEIPKEQKNKWEKERREKDKIEQLIKIEGFHNKSNGRSGTIYYVEKGKICELYYEISGVKKFDILIWFDQLTDWIFPNKEPIKIEDKEAIKNKLVDWLDQNRIRAEL